MHFLNREKQNKLSSCSKHVYVPTNLANREFYFLFVFVQNSGTVSCKSSTLNKISVSKYFLTIRYEVPTKKR